MTNPNFTASSNLTAAEAALYFMKDYGRGRVKSPIHLKILSFTAEDVANKIFSLPGENKLVDDPDRRSSWDGVYLLKTEDGKFEVFSGERGGKLKLKEFESLKDAIIYKIQTICNESGGTLKKQT